MNNSLMYVIFCALSLLLSCSLSDDGTGGSLSSRGGTEDGSEEWRYIPVRAGASMFYWFYRTTHPDGYLNRPIVLWLQGGPGLSGTGLGNFLEIGPLDQNLEPRMSSWIETVNLLFIDCPAGVGFSVLTNESMIANNTDDISFDTIEMLQVFMKEHPYFQETPFYIFGQSYGASLAVALGYYLNEVIQAGVMNCNLKGIAMGNGCLSLIDPFLTWPDIMYEMSLIDHQGYMQMKEVAEYMADIAKNSKNDTERLEKLRQAESTFLQAHFYNAPCMSLYNILDVAPVGHFIADDDPQMFSSCSSYKSIYAKNISLLMNGPIREKLAIIPDDVVWKLKSQEVYWAQATSYDLYQDKWPIVDKLLNTSNIDVIIYQGQLDLICSTAATIAWMQRLNWPGLESYNAAERKVLTNPDTDVPEMFVKSFENLKMYWVLNSGHAVPGDVPDVALRMLNRILDGID